MATQASSLPVSDLEYPVQLAHSFQPGEDRDGGLCLLQYHFKPASAGRFQDGRVCVDSDQQKVLLQLPNSSSQACDLDFTGVYEPSKDGLDCVACFDGSTWHLQLVGAVARNVRHAPGSFPLPADPTPSSTQPISDPLQQQPHTQQAMPMIEDLDAPDPQDQAQARSPSPAAPEDTGTDEAGQPSDENADLEQEFENMLQDAASPEPPESLPEQPQASEKPAGVEQTVASPAPQRAAKPVPLPSRLQAAHAGLGEVAREFLQEPSDSDLDEEDLNRCSDDDVDDLDG